MRYLYTLLLGAFGILICLVHAGGWDPDQAILYHLSVPVWFLEVFVDIHSLPMIVTYVLTILFWAAFGALIDWARARARTHA